MLSAIVDGGDAVVAPTIPPPPPAPTPAPPAPSPTPHTGPILPRNALGEDLGQAEAAVLALVAQGMSGAAALALHPLPQGTSTAEALAFLAELPQTTYAIDNPAGIVTGPPLADGPPVTDEGDGGDVERTTLSAYKPAGIVAQWHNLLHVFKVTAPKKRDAVTGMFDNPKEFWK